jgi:hypothetical protein
VSAGILRIPKQLPTNTRDWEQFTRKLNEAIQHDGDRAVIDALTTISERTGTDLETLLDLIGDDGRASTQRFMPLINWANAGSLQSAIPITASANAVTATVNIDAHDVLYGGEQVSYNAGSVVGAPVDTPVYIYVDDEDLEGGAVTYEYTEDFTDLVSTRHRYYVGAILTPISSISASVSAVTNANPCVVTTGAAHGFSTGDTVDFSSVGGTTELNTGTYVITVLTSTTFSLNGVNSTAYGVYTSGGTVTRVSTPADGLGGAGGHKEFYDPRFFY